MSRQEEDDLYVGYWGEVFRLHLKEKKPKLYEKFRQNGYLKEYLEIYQAAYTERAHILLARYSKKKGLDDDAFHNNLFYFIAETYKIHMKIRKQLTEEIQKL